MKGQFPAFPFTYMGINSIGERSVQEQFSGITERDYFAAKAMQGMMSNSANEIYEQVHERPDSIMFKAISAISYEIADAMLEAREK